MPYSYANFTGDGAQTDFVFSFPYLDQEDISVLVDSVSTSFTWISTNSIRISPAPANGAIGRIQRVTLDPTQKVTFTDASVLDEDDLNLLALYDQYIAEEAADGIAQTISLNASGLWQGQTRRAEDFVDPVNAQDLATKNYVDSTTPASAAAAAASAAAAAVSETNAAGYAGRYSGTSTTSVAIGSGAKSFTTQTDKFFDPGAFVLITDDAAPTTNWMWGQVTGYTGGALDVNVNTFAGSGTLAAWTITVSGARGAQGTSGSLPDGDYGDITVSSSGTVLNIDPNTIGVAELSTTAGKVLVGLTVATDKLPYFNSGTTAATTDFTALGRTLVGAADAAAVRTAIDIKAPITNTKTNASTYNIPYATWSATVSDLTATITPTDTSKKVKITLSVTLGINTTSNAVLVRLMRDTTPIALGTDGISFTQHFTGSGEARTVTFVFIDSPATASAITYGFQMSHYGGSSVDVHINRRHATPTDVAGMSSIIVEEID